MKTFLMWMMSVCVVVGLLLAPALAQPSPTAVLKVHDPTDLEIGKVAPDIEAEDLNGVTFKLSDYRGKVVVLDFWGDW